MRRPHETQRNPRARTHAQPQLELALVTVDHLQAGRLTGREHVVAVGGEVEDLGALGASEREDQKLLHTKAIACQP